MTCSSPKSSSSPGPSKITLPVPTPKRGAICGTPTTCISKSLNISLDLPADRMALDAPALAEEQERALLLRQRHRRRSPRAKRSMGALAKTSVNSNSAIARPNIEKSIGAPAATSGKARRTARGTPATR